MEVEMKQSIIAILITTIMTVCGVTVDKNNSNLPNKETETVGGVVETSLVMVETVTIGCEVSTKEDETDSTVVSTPETTANRETTSIPEKTTNIELETTTKKEPVTTAPETTTKKQPITTVPETTTKKQPITTVPETTTKKEPAITIPETTTKKENGQNLSYARQVVELVNKEREKAGLNALTIDTKLEEAALIRAKEIEKSFSHTRPNGSNFSTVLTENGISFRGAGENIAWGQSTPEIVMNGWMNSPGHRANILNAKFTKIGVGYYVGANGRKYWTQIFTY